MEKMTAAELKMLHELQAKQKRAQRAEMEFLKEADSRKEDLLARWKVKDRLAVAAEKIGATPDELYDWITSEEQISYYRRKHNTTEPIFFNEE